MKQQNITKVSTPLHLGRGRGRVCRGLSLFFFLLFSSLSAFADNSVAGLFPLEGSGRVIYNFNQGWRFHLSNIMAAIGRVQLSRFEKEFVPARKHLAALYRELLTGVQGVELLDQDPEDDIVLHIQPVKVLNGKMPAVRQYLREHGIPVGVHYKPNHLHSYFSDPSAAPLPVTERLYGELMTIPMHPALSDDDVRLVCSTLKEALSKD